MKQNIKPLKRSITRIEIEAVMKRLLIKKKFQSQMNSLLDSLRSIQKNTNAPQTVP
jgi:hypothetical protein